MDRRHEGKKHTKQEETSAWPAALSWFPGF
jgi:hypothetical protein